MTSDAMGESMGRVTAEALIDAGAAGVMLNHASNPMDTPSLETAIGRARCNGLHTIVCAGTDAETRLFARLAPTVVLFEPPQLIGTEGSGSRDWIAHANAVVRSITPAVLMMHAGGVSSPSIAEAIMALGADGTGATSGVIKSPDPLAAARTFIAATRSGWVRAQQPA
jgi:triosephosphate isomerase